jgi:ATP synthase protein I
MFYVGEVLKLCLTAVLFVLTLAYLPVNVLACLVGFIVAQVAFWLAPLLTSMKKLPIP